MIGFANSTERRAAPGPLSTCLPVFMVLLVAAPAAAQMPDLAALSGMGPHEVETYTDFPDVPEFAAGTIYHPIYHPADAQDPIAGVAIAPGFTEEQRHIDWWGPRLASHGFAVLTLDTNEPGDRPDVRADALLAAVEILRGENDREGSPLEGRIDPERMAVMGHSMGGGGALLAAHAAGDEVQAAIPFTPWQPDADFSGVTAPTLVLAGSADGIAPVDEHSWPHFEAIPESTTKVYLEIEGGDHFIADTERGPDLELMGRYGIGWLKLHLDGEEAYRDMFFGEPPEEDRAKFSRYLTNP